jgi:nucleotide-binding universal stress UspA family protein
LVNLTAYSLTWINAGTPLVVVWCSRRRELIVTTRLLCAIDAAYPCPLSVEAAVEMAQLLRVPITFLTINPVVQEGPSEAHFWDDRIIAAVDTQLSNVLTDAATVARRSGLSDFDCVVASGVSIAAAIVDYAQKNRFDHIVLGSSRLPAPFSATHVSVAAEAIKTAKCPVTIVR